MPRAQRHLLQDVIKAFEQLWLESLEIFSNALWIRSGIEQRLNVCPVAQPHRPEFQKHERANVYDRDLARQSRIGESISESRIVGLQQIDRNVTDCDWHAWTKCDQTTGVFLERCCIHQEVDIFGGPRSAMSADR